MKNKFVSLASVVMFTAGAIMFSSVSASAQEVPQLSPGEEAHLYAFFDEYGVDPITQNELIHKMSEGQPWDSFSPGENPISSVTSNELSKIVTIDTYADGSLLVTEMEVPHEIDGGIQPFGVSGCVRTDSGTFASYWSNCHVKANTGALEMGFYVNYENIKTVGSKITSFWGKHHYIVGGTLSNHNLYRVNNQQVRYAADYQSTLFPIGYNVWVQANLSGSALSMTTS